MQLLKDLLYTLHLWIPSLEIPNLSVPLPKPIELSKLKIIFQNGDLDQLESELKHLNEQIQDLLSYIRGTPDATISLRLNALLQIESQITRTINEIRVSANVPGLRLRELFNKKALEGLVIGTGSQNRVICQYSLADVPQIIEGTKLLILYERKFSHAPHLIDLIS